MGLGALPSWGQDIVLPARAEVQQMRNGALLVLERILQDSHSKDTDRLSAVHALLKSNDRNVLPLLAEVLLNDPAPFVRRAVAEGLSRFLTGSPTSALQQAALTDPIASIRWAAGVSLVQWNPGAPEMIGKLLRDPSTLAAAAISLQEAAAANLFPRALWPLVLDAMTAAFPARSTYNSVERAAMLKSLAQLRATDAISLLRQTLNAIEEDAFVRGAAAYALGVLVVSEAVPELITALASNQAALQLAAAGALSHMRDERALEPLTETLRGAPSAEVRAAAAMALGPFGQVAVPPLAQALEIDPAPTVRQAALGELTRVGGAEATQAVLSFLDSGYLQTCEPSACSSVALETLVALAKLGQGAMAVQLLESTLAAVRDVLPLFFAFAEQALVNVVIEVGRAAPQVFQMLLHDESPYVQALGLAALANLQGRASRETLLRFLEPDGVVIVRRAALEGLSKWAIRDDLSILIPEIINRDRRSRIAALSALTRLGDARLVQPLNAALASDSVAIRLDAAGAALVWAQRMMLRIEARDCEADVRRSPNQMFYCLEHGS